MSGVTNELMCELLKRTQHDVSGLRLALSEVKKELNVIRGHMVGIQADIHNICGILGRHDERLDRIGRRLELRELAEAQKGFDPKS